MPALEAQSFENLNPLEGHNIQTYYSTGSQEQAATQTARCDRVLHFYQSMLDFEPQVTLLVLSPSDWGTYTGFPVYGMPHLLDRNTLVVASEDNDFWRSFIPPPDQLPDELARQISTTYSDSNKQITMRGFFDLLAIHELGHAFHLQGELKMQRKWMEELFANLFLYTYVAEKEPHLLPASTVFPQTVVAITDKKDLPYTSLTDLETNYNLITQQYPQNYGWYQSRLHLAAENIYEAGGIDAFQNLWIVLKNQDEPLDDASLAALLSKKVDPSVAGVLLKWGE